MTLEELKCLWLKADLKKFWNDIEVRISEANEEYRKARARSKGGFV